MIIRSSFHKSFLSCRKCKHEQLGTRRDGSTHYHMCSLWLAEAGIRIRRKACLWAYILAEHLWRGAFHIFLIHWRRVEAGKGPEDLQCKLQQA
jgi:hypothetical protein